MLMWRYFSQPHLECRVKCTQAGHIITDDDDYQGSKESVKTVTSNIIDSYACSTSNEKEEGKQQPLYDSALLRKAVRRALMCHRRKAIVFLVAGILINGIWITPLLILEDNIAYKPHEQSPI